jgi:hypothetical protein
MYCASVVEIKTILFQYLNAIFRAILNLWLSWAVLSHYSKKYSAVMDINATTPTAHFGPANLSLSHISQCIMRRFMTFTTRILLGCRHQRWQLVLDVWHVWERRYIYDYGRKSRRNKDTLKRGVQKRRLIKVRTCQHSIKTSDDFALLWPNHSKFVNTLQKRPSICTFNKHYMISPHLGNRFTIDKTNIAIEIYNRQP